MMTVPEPFGRRCAGTVPRSGSPVPFFLGLFLSLCPLTLPGQESGENEKREKAVNVVPVEATEMRVDPELSAAAARVTGLSGQYVSGTARIAAARGLSRNLSVKDTRALLALVEGDRPAGVSPPLWHVLTNDVQDRLLSQERSVPGLAEHLVSSARAQADPVLRDYALQKIPALLSLPSLPSAAHAEALKALTDTATLEGHDFQGTALLSWARILEKKGEKETATERAFKKAALACLASEKTTLPARVSALQAAARAGFREAAPVARGLLASTDSGRAPTAVKLAALAALGRTGDKMGDTPLLTSFSLDPVLGAASLAALKTLSSSQP